jgi:hypothetical protein
MRARKNDNMRIMQENVSLIKEINNMRREIKQMHQVQRQKVAHNPLHQRPSPSRHNSINDNTI